MTKVALFADIPGLWWAATRFGSARVDYAKLRREVAGTERQLIHCAAWLKQRPGLDRFEAALRHVGYNTNVIGQDADIDKLIVDAVHATLGNSQVDVVAIAASSGRYSVLGQELAARGIRLEVWSFPVACALDELRVERRVLGDEVLLAS